MTEVVWQLERHQVILKHEEVKGEVLNPVVDVPCLSNHLFDSVLLVDKELIAFDRSPRDKHEASLFDVLLVLEKKLLDDHLNGVEFGSDDVYLNVSFILRSM